MDLGVLRTAVGGDALFDLASCRQALANIRTARGFLDALEVEALGVIDGIAVSEPILPEAEVADASKTSLSKAGRVRARKKACDDVPQLADALATGHTTGERVDLVARATNGLSADELAKVAAHGAQLALAAVNANDRQFREVVDRIVGAARSDDGLDQLARQRRNTRLRWWTGPDGMWNLSGRFDPARGLELQGRLLNAKETMFHRPPSADAPTDPFERDEHLNALALLALSEGRGGSGLPEVVVLIDADTLVAGVRHEGSVVDVGAGNNFGIPIETIRRWACIGSINPVVVAADGTRLYLGRETRLANRAQRRALRVLYRSCALCDVSFDRCHVHHVHWYGRHLGGTDIDNLLPLCNRHHHLVHEGGWTLHLAPDRTLTLTLPDGSAHQHAPPTTRAA